MSNQESFHICTANHPKYEKNLFEDLGKPGVSMGAALLANLWNQGQTLKICFLDDGLDTLKQKVINFAMKWTQYINLKFEFVSKDQVKEAQIRISFTYEEDESWSYVGKEALGIPLNEPTMNLALKENTPNSKIQEVVLHEFGHAIGMIHEHQHPKAKINWNKSAIKVDGWTDEIIESNIINRYDLQKVARKSQVEFDPDSIMLYPISPAWTTDGQGTKWNTDISAGDIKYISYVYPKK